MRKSFGRLYVSESERGGGERCIGVIGTGGVRWIGMTSKRGKDEGGGRGKGTGKKTRVLKRVNASGCLANILSLSFGPLISQDSRLIIH